VFIFRLVIIQIIRKWIKGEEQRRGQDKSRINCVTTLTPPRKKKGRKGRKGKKEKGTHPERATTLLTPLVGSRKNAKSLEGSHISVIVLGRYPPIE